MTPAPNVPERDMSTTIIAILIAGIVLIVILLLWKSYAVPVTDTVNSNMTSSGMLIN